MLEIYDTITGNNAKIVLWVCLYDNYTGSKEAALSLKTIRRITGIVDLDADGSRMVTLVLLLNYIELRLPFSGGHKKHFLLDLSTIKQPNKSG